ncbi:MAG TPA: hypothetical protein V6D09_12220 [Leptolyngbyaceae cyanobacterium]
MTQQISSAQEQKLLEILELVQQGEEKLGKLVRNPQNWHINVKVGMNRTLKGCIPTLQ